MLILETGKIKFLSRDIFVGRKVDFASIEYKELIIIRHSANAYQAYLHYNSPEDGQVIEAYEVFSDEIKVKVFQETIKPQEGDSESF
jgi:hypothetical protein